MMFLFLVLCRFPGASEALIERALKERELAAVKKAGGSTKVMK
jgi:hypothetical protein